MTTFKRLASASAFVFFLFCSTHAQTPSVSTVNVTPDERKVSVAAVGDVLDLRVSVSDESGDIVFESGPVAGDKLDWRMRDAQGQRVPAGSYLLSVTYRTSSGKLKRRVEQVFVTEEVTGTTSAAAEDTTPQAVGTITGQGTTGRISKFTGANSIGNSVLTESSGRIGLGTTAPTQSLHVLGASSRLRLQSVGSTAQTATEYVTNNRVWATGAGGSATGTVTGKYFIQDQTANQYRLVIDTAGNFGLGTTAPASRLTVNGGIQILGAGNGIKFADGSIQTKAIAGTINGTGTANRIAKFTGPNSFGNSAITEVSGRVGIGTTSPAANLQVQGSGFMDVQVRSINERASLSLNAGLGGGNTVWSLENGLYGSPGLFGIYDRSQDRARLVIDQAGNIGIGTTAPLRELQFGADPGAAFTISPSNGSPNAGFIRFGDNTGWKLHFGRNREFSGAPLNFGTQGVLMTIQDNGEVVVGQITNLREQDRAKLKAIADKGVSGPGSDGLLAVGGYSTDSNSGYGIAAFGGNADATGTYAGIGIFAQGGSYNGANGAHGNYAGFFQGGGVYINGSLDVSGSKDFKIDHPLDPENKYLLHASIESSEVLNVYSGNIVLGPQGEAVVTMPDWFGALNRDFRYQLTPIGAPARGLYVAEEISQNRFKIAGGAPGMKVSWQVTGVRSDAYMRMHPFAVEQDKPVRERGTYISPEAFGQPEEKGMVKTLFPEMKGRKK